jgi:hypothetical protein
MVCDSIILHRQACSGHRLDQRNEGAGYCSTIDQFHFRPPTQSGEMPASEQTIRDVGAQFSMSTSDVGVAQKTAKDSARKS